jgi:hypothetical protein
MSWQSLQIGFLILISFLLCFFVFKLWFYFELDVCLFLKGLYLTSALIRQSSILNGRCEFTMKQWFFVINDSDLFTIYWNLLIVVGSTWSKWFRSIEAMKGANSSSSLTISCNVQNKNSSCFVEWIPNNVIHCLWYPSNWSKNGFYIGNMMWSGSLLVSNISNLQSPALYLLLLFL